jgi:hypothetical protein
VASVELQDNIALAPETILVGDWDSDTVGAGLAPVLPLLWLPPHATSEAQMRSGMPHHRIWRAISATVLEYVALVSSIVFARRIESPLEAIWESGIFIMEQSNNCGALILDSDPRDNLYLNCSSLIWGECHSIKLWFAQTGCGSAGVFRIRSSSGQA